MKACLDCSKELSAKNKSGRCIPCGNRHRGNDPEFQRRRADGIRHKFATDLEFRARRTASLLRSRDKAMTDPEMREKLAEHGRRQFREYLSKPEVRERNVAAIRANSHKISDHFLAWCPAEFREMHKHNVRSKRMLSADSRKIIEKLAADREAIRNMDDVLHFMRRLTPVSRCDRRGRALPEGQYFRVGNAVLTSGELLNRAKTRGYCAAANDTSHFLPSAHFSAGA